MALPWNVPWKLHGAMERPMAIFHDNAMELLNIGMTLPWRKHGIAMGGVWCRHGLP